MKHDGSIGTAGKGLLTSDELAFTVAATQDQTLCVSSYGIQDDHTPKFGEELAPTLRRGGDGGTHQHVATSEYIVRRLTPEECERLQGMPTGHTRIPWKGKPAEECPDGPRYKAIGNSFAVPVVRWLGVRLEEVDRIMRESDGDTRG